MTFLPVKCVCTMIVAANRLFIDTNILVSAIVPESPRYFHAQGVWERVEASDAETWISRQVLREFLSSMSRHYTTPRRFSTPELLAAAAQLEQQYFVAEDHGLVTQQLFLLLDRVPTGGKQIHDANIVATMLAYDIPHLLSERRRFYGRRWRGRHPGGGGKRPVSMIVSSMVQCGPDSELR